MALCPQVEGTDFEKCANQAKTQVGTSRSLATPRNEA
jgi:hypothetical protein